MPLTRRAFLHQLALAASSLTCTAGSQWALAEEPGFRKLRVTGCRTLVVNNVPPYAGGRQWLFVQLLTNEGIVGLGERPAGTVQNPRAQTELIHALCERFVVGQSPFAVERIWQSAYASYHDYRHPGLYGTPALSAIEMACWDLIGKATQQPVYNLLGGQVHDKLWAYRYLDMAGVHEQPELAATRATQLIEQSITCCKLDPFPSRVPWPRDFQLAEINKAAQIFRIIRDAIGDKLEIGIGTHGQFNTGSAIRVAKALEEFAPLFFEEPVPPENVDEMAQVASHTSIPIATGERLVTKYEFAELLDKHAAHIIQLDVGQCGGILESKKIAALAEASYASIAPHMFCGPVATAAAVQLDVCCPNFLIQEYNTTPLHSDIFVEPLRCENGHIIPPTAAGLGIELNDKVLKRQLAS